MPLKQLFEIGINGKLWRLLKSWYTDSPSRVRLNNRLSDAFLIGRGVKQGSVLFPSLFLTVMDSLLKRRMERNVGSSIRGVYIGAAIHADDLRTTAATRDEVRQQADVIQDFTQDTCLNLNVSKLEVVKISKISHAVETLLVAGHSVTTTSAAKCLGVCWQSNLSASLSANENIKKARKAFFAIGNLGAFKGELNSLSTSSIFETCILFYSMAVRLGCLTPLVCQPLRVSSVKLDVEFFACQNTTLAMQFI